jgi:hypothetical protein
MNKITSVPELRAAIILLEIKQAEEGKLLKEQFKVTYENLRPANLIKNTLRDLTSDPSLKGELFNTTLGLAAGYLTKKAVVGATHNPLKQIFGTLLQMGISSIVAKNGDGIKSGAMDLIANIFRKKEDERL